MTLRKRTAMSGVLSPHYVLSAITQELEKSTDDAASVALTLLPESVVS
jgi:hypothetical protein